MGPIEEWLEICDGRDVMSSQQMRQDRSGCSSVRQRFVRTVQRNVVASADIGQPVGELALRVETSRHPKGAQSPLERITETS